MTEPLRLTILGGFLGAGKTTWLRHQLHAGFYADTHLIVNEAAAEPVDGLLLTAASGLTLLAGGCSCCDGQERLREALRALCDRRSAARGSRAVLLETSGVADPGRIAALIRSDPVLARHVTLAEVIVLVDAVEGPARIAAEPLARAQIMAADRIILTKTDRPEALSLDRLRASLRHLAPGAEMTAAVAGVAVLLPPADPAADPIEIGPDDKDPIQAHVVSVKEVGWPVLSVWLSALVHARGGDLIRIKGVVDTPAGPLLLQSVAAQMQPPERMDASTGHLVVIGRGTSQAALEGSMARWAGR